MGKMPMQKKSIERIIAFAICSIEFIIIILILCINGYNSIKKPIGSTYCADQIFDVVNSDAISFFGTDFYGDGTYMVRLHWTTAHTPYMIIRIQFVLLHPE